MKLGYSTNAFVRGSLFDAVDDIAELGFGGIEIMGDRPHLYPPDWSENSLQKLKERINETGLKITNINSFTLFAVGDTYLPSWIEQDRQRREIRIQHTLQSLRVAAKLGCTNISVPPGGPLTGMNHSEAIRLFHGGLERVVPLAEALEVKILIEPEPDLLMENTSQFLDFISDVRSTWVGVNFDIGHFFCAGEDPAESFRRLLPWIGHVHIEDIGADRRHHHLIPGEGAIHFESVLRMIRETGYEGDISLELYTYADKPVEAGRRSLAHLLPILAKAEFNTADILLKNG
ncbi:MAG: sugar phosphate isomerase/epimerase [Deltaproteobacteria bacterium]|jgi:sugar phosphate isomerase/epimerase|nr:sugar phosphate isomerase/epimerase [Deltaproteobacteria bacterium]